MFEDKTLKCKECGAEFVFTAGEQAFYAEKGFQNEHVLITAMLDIGTMMMELAGLSFLGLGAQIPMAEWGSMMGYSKRIRGDE